MGCIVVLLALALPRLVMVVAFLMTNWFAQAFETRLWPFLGFLFMPYTTLAYIGAMLNNNHAVSGGWLIIFIVAIVFDVSHWGGSGRTYHRSRNKSS